MTPKALPVPAEDFALLTVQEWTCFAPYVMSRPVTDLRHPPRGCVVALLGFRVVPSRSVRLVG